MIGAILIIYLVIALLVFLGLSIFNMITLGQDHKHGYAADMFISFQYIIFVVSLLWIVFAVVLIFKRG